MLVQERPCLQLRMRCCAASSGSFAFLSRLIPSLRRRWADASQNSFLFCAQFSSYLPILKLVHCCMSFLHNGFHMNATDLSPLSSPEPMTKPCTVKMPAGNSCLLVVAERIKWKLSPSFDPTPFLSDPVVRSVFLRPDTLRVAPGTRPELPGSQVRCTRSELLALASKWDRCKALQLIPCAEVKDSEACGIFCVPKSSEFDRLILNPSAINAQMIKYKLDQTPDPRIHLVLGSFAARRGFQIFCR